ncbi:alpha/beta hydrolase [Nocardioides scoriae]|uniref:alpha/beta hydrolase n=1 Tax=Nocardioides scoriae TaxID=642780 RepID=UPI0015607A3E|nr:alpha/beta hydrolase [Nocardioides scoriae]
MLSADYRRATPTQPTWDKVPQDVACALVWSTRNAGRFGGNPSQLAVLGDSAGGNLATNLTLSASSGKAAGGCGPVPKPDALVAQYPQVDVAATREAFVIGGPDTDPEHLVELYIGGTMDEHPDRVKAISSQTYLTDQAPPTLLIEPERDGIIRTDAVLGWAKKAEDAGVDLTVAKIPFANHVYNQQAYNSIGNQARRTITQNYLVDQGLTNQGTPVPPIWTHLTLTLRHSRSVGKTEVARWKRTDLRGLWRR